MMNKEEILKTIMGLPKVETNNPISAMNGISVNDLMSAVDRFDKVPTYDELLKENKDLQQRIDKAIGYIKNKKELNKMFGTITLSKDSQDELLEILGGKE